LAFCGANLAWFEVEFSKDLENSAHIPHRDSGFGGLLIINVGAFYLIINVGAF
jgi:hypothetical protein